VAALMLSAFVVAQLVFDVAVVAFAVVYLLTRQSPPPEPIEPPEWYGHFLKVAQDVMVVTEPVLDRLESRAAPLPASMAPPSMPPAAAPAPAPMPARDPYAEARKLLRAGVALDEVADRAGLQPGELRLLAKVVAAESRRRSG
jgi:hypothetical protein